LFSQIIAAYNMWSSTKNYHFWIDNGLQICIYKSIWEIIYLKFTISTNYWFM